MWGQVIEGCRIIVRALAFTHSERDATHSVAEHDGISMISLASVLKTGWGEARTEADRPVRRWGM